MKRLVFFCLCLLQFAGPSLAQELHYVTPPRDIKYLRIGADPVMPQGFPADSAQALGLKYMRFMDMSVWVRCLSGSGRESVGWLPPGEAVFTKLLTITETDSIYRVLIIQACGNPVLDGAGAVPIIRPSVVEAQPPTVVEPVTIEPQPEVPVTLVVTKKSDQGFPFGAWLGVAASKSFESRAFDSFEGLYLDFYPISGLTWKFGAATSQSNFDKFRGGVTHNRDYAANMSRLQTGLAFKPWDDFLLQALVGVQYDHKVGGWQPGPLLEGYTTFPLGPIRNEHDVTYQTGTEALWFRIRQWIPILEHDSTVLAVGGEFMRNSFRDNPTGRYYHYYTTRGNGILRLETTWLNGRKCVVLGGIGRGSESEKWGAILEFGFGLK